MVSELLPNLERPFWDREDSEGLSEKVTCKQNAEWSEGVSPVHIFLGKKLSRHRCDHSWHVRTRKDGVEREWGKYVPQGQRSCSPRIALSSIRRIADAQWMLVEWIDGRWKSGSLNEWTNKWFILQNKPRIQKKGEKVVGKLPKWGLSCERLRVWTRARL